MRNNKIILAVFLALVAGAIAGYLLTHQENSALGAANPAGSTYRNATVLAQDFVVSSSTVFAMQNTGSGDYVVTGLQFFAQGSTATSSNYLLQCATSSTQYTPVNTNLVVNQTLNTLGTTTGAGMYFASTSPGASGVPFGAASTTARIVPAGAWLTCSTTNSVANANSANTLDANTTGFLAFPYQQF